MVLDINILCQELKNQKKKTDDMDTSDFTQELHAKALERDKAKEAEEQKKKEKEKKREKI